MVFYRKYRPQTIEDLDSKAVRETLHAVLQKNTPHAFLFTGPKGLGKTSTARIVAKVVNCERLGERKGSLEPCNECGQCVSITNGTNVDILEIDAASNRGIDEIRELKEKIRLSPVAAKKKVYIIDEVHMLTTEAFNALLKTLEEPPDHAIFILCTTEAHKVPETIVSRCFQIRFAPATEEELVRSFKRIVAGEKITISDEALHAIAKMIDGGFRDGVKILEETIQLAGEKAVTKEFIETHYNVKTISISALDLLVNLERKKVKESLTDISNLVEQGVDVKQYITFLLHVLHKYLLKEMGIAGENLPEEYPFRFTLEEIKKLTELFTKAYSDIRTAVIPQLPLELAVIEWCEDKLKEQRAKLKVSNEVSKSIVTDETEVSVSSLRKQVGTIKKIKALYGSSKEDNKDIVSIEPVIASSTIELLQTAGDVITGEWVELFWNSLLSEMKKYNHTIAGVLRGCKIKSFEKQHLIIQTAYKFHKERLDDMKTREALLKISKLLTGKEVEITVELRK